LSGTFVLFSHEFHEQSGRAPLAAEKCLLEKGYNRTTARDIVSSAGVSLAAIGYHFSSKEALLTEALLDSFGEWDQDLQP
jgi:AcrR family transcriptional regulator